MLLLKHLKPICSHDEFKAIINAKDSNGNIPIFYAVFRGNLSIVKYLIKNGSDINASNNKGMFILHFAAQGDQTPMLIYFKEKYNHDIYQKDNGGSTPLHYACNFGSVKSINFLLCWISSIDIKNEKGETPLYLALFSERTHLIKKLLKKGADPNIKCGEGKSILDIVKENSGFRSIYKMILDVNKSTKCLNSIKINTIYSPASFCVLLVLIALINTFLLLPVINSYYHTFTYYFLLLSLFIFFSFMSMSNSGIIVNNQYMTWLNLTELNVNIDAMCPYCKVKKDFKSKHCYTCNHCIQDFDHHCTWINNCIGRGNKEYFTAFLIEVIINLSYGYYIGYKFYNVDIDSSFSNTIRLSISAIMMALYLLLFIPVVFLLYFQLKKGICS